MRFQIIIASLSEKYFLPIELNRDNFIILSREMGEPVSVIATIINASLFLFLALYIIFMKRDKNPSHYFFSMMSISLFLYSLIETFKFGGDYNIALHMAIIAPEFLGIAVYFFLLFTYYLKIGLNKDLVIILLFPLIFGLGFSHLYLIDNIRYTPYGWVSVFNLPALIIYSSLLHTYFILGIWNLVVVYKNMEGSLRSRILYLLTGTLIVLVFSILYTLQMIENEYLLPFLNFSFVILGIIYFWILLR